MEEGPWVPGHRRCSNTAVLLPGSSCPAMLAACYKQSDRSHCDSISESCERIPPKLPRRRTENKNLKKPHFPDGEPRLSPHAHVGFPSPALFAQSGKTGLAKTEMVSLCSARGRSFDWDGCSSVGMFLHENSSPVVMIVRCVRHGHSHFDAATLYCSRHSSAWHHMKLPAALERWLQTSQGVGIVLSPRCQNLDAVDLLSLKPARLKLPRLEGPERSVDEAGVGSLRQRELPTIRNSTRPAKSQLSGLFCVFVVLCSRFPHSIQRIHFHREDGAEIRQRHFEEVQESCEDP